MNIYYLNKGIIFNVSDRIEVLYSYKYILDFVVDGFGTSFWILSDNSTLLNNPLYPLSGTQDAAIYYFHPNKELIFSTYYGGFPTTNTVCM